MLTQHTPRVPHRPALPLGTETVLTLIALALVTVLAIVLMVQTRPSTTIEDPLVSQSVPLGIYAPTNMGLAQMPRGYTDYLLDRSGLPVASVVSQSFTPGIVAQQGMDLTHMPRGYTDYLLNPVVPQVVQPIVLGIAAQPGMDLKNMPRGYTDYLIIETIHDR